MSAFADAVDWLVREGAAGGVLHGLSDHFRDRLLVQDRAAVLFIHAYMLICVAAVLFIHGYICVNIVVVLFLFAFVVFASPRYTFENLFPCTFCYHRTGWRLTSTAPTCTTPSARPRSSRFFLALHVFVACLFVFVAFAFSSLHRSANILLRLGMISFGFAVCLFVTCAVSSGFHQRR
jgi:hypothetical protein